MREKEYYRSRIQKFIAEKNRLNKIIRTLTWTRLLSFLGAIVAFYLLFSLNVAAAILTSVLILGVFIWSIIKYNQVQRKKAFTERLAEINENEISALQGDIKKFANGSQFMDSDHSFSYDMDIFGEGSLYQFLNRTRSEEGKSILASFLSENERNRLIIIDRQKIIHELSEKIEFRHRFMASFSLTDIYQPHQKSQLFGWLYNQTSFFKNKTLPLISFILPAVFMVLIVLSVLTVIPAELLFYVFLIHLGFIGSRLKEINHIHSLLSEHGMKLKEYAEILAIIEKEKFSSKIANQLKSALHHGNETSSKTLKRLGGLVETFDNRLNLVVNILLNGLFLWDFHCIRRLEKWKNSHRDSIAHWFSSINQFDAYISLANFNFNYPENCTPVFCDDDSFLHTENMGHPLIDPRELVRNDFSMFDNNFIIITGANMAGKSTFLRMAGINLVLAMAGANVCADRFVFKPVKLFTSMRTSDSLQKNESYFYAELKRLKDLLELIKKDKEVMIILDEILKGTNSEDKQKGSKMFLDQLVTRNTTGIIATHDLSLAAMEEKHPGKIKNMCFEIEIEGSNIHFDYKLKNGVTRKMNASILMEQMGLLEAPGNS